MFYFFLPDPLSEGFTEMKSSILYY